MSSIAPVLRAARIANSVAFGLQGFFFAVVLTELPQQKERFGLSDGLIVGSVVLVSLLAGAGSVAAEQLAIRWSSHGFGEVKEFCDKYGKPLVRLPAGYNPNQVAFHLLSQVGDRLGSPARATV